MSDPADYYLQPLSWHQVRGAPEVYDLRAIPGPIGRLTFESRTVALAETADAAWRFASSGILRRQCSITLVPQGRQLGVCRYPVWGSIGTLRLPPGLVIHFGHSTWDRVYSVTDERGRVVLSYDFRGFIGLRSPVTWGVAPGPAEQIAWLLYFSWYLAVRWYRETRAAAAAVIIGS